MSEAYTSFKIFTVLSGLFNREKGRQLTEAEQKCIFAILTGNNVLMAAETGSRKSDIFCLPVVQIIWETMRDIQSGKLINSFGRSTKSPLCVIIEPTKELANQIYKEIEIFKKLLNSSTIKNVLVTEEKSILLHKFEIGNGCDIVVCTPGRVQDLFKHNYISMEHVRFFVLDEADSLVSGQFNSLEIIRKLHSKMTTNFSIGQCLQMIVCSQNPQCYDIQKLMNEFNINPDVIDLRTHDLAVTTLNPNTQELILNELKELNNQVKELNNQVKDLRSNWPLFFHSILKSFIVSFLVFGTMAAFCFCFTGHFPEPTFFFLGFILFTASRTYFIYQGLKRAEFEKHQPQ